MAVLGIAGLIALQGCTSYVSKGITDDGKAEELVWPAEQSSRQPEGRLASRESLRAIRPGATKNQIYDLLGPPHFSEGMVAVREWDYILKIPSAGDEVLTCRYKIIFDKSYKAQSIYSSPVGCAGQRV